MHPAAGFSTCRNARRRSESGDIALPVWNRQRGVAATSTATWAKGAIGTDRATRRLAVGPSASRARGEARTAQVVRCRIGSASSIGRRGDGTVSKEVVEEIDRVGDVDRSRVVDVGAPQARGIPPARDEMEPEARYPHRRNRRPRNASRR